MIQIRMFQSVYMNVVRCSFEKWIYNALVYLFLFAVILQELQQTDLNSIFNGIFNSVGNTEQIKFNVNFVQIDRNHLDESLANCEQ